MLLRNLVGQTIRKERQSKNWSLRKLSSKSYVSLSHLSEIERGLKEASSEMLNYICNGLDISLQELMIDVVAEMGKENYNLDLEPKVLERL